MSAAGTFLIVVVVVVAIVLLGLDIFIGSVVNKIEDHVRKDREQ